MNWKMWVGIVLILAGVAALVCGGITWSSRKPIIQVGTVHMDVTVQHHVLDEPVIGGVAIAAGVVLIVLSRKSPKS